MLAIVIAGLVRSPQNNSVHYRQSYRHMTVKVDATAWSLHQWTAGGNVPTLRSGVTSAGQRHASCCDASPMSGSLPGSGLDCWLATEQEWWSLVFHKLTTAQSHVPCGEERCPVEKLRSRQTRREWLAEAVDEARHIRIHSDLAFLSHIV